MRITIYLQKKTRQTVLCQVNIAIVPDINGCFNNREVVDSRTAGFLYGIRHAFIVFLQTLSHSSLNSYKQAVSRMKMLAVQVSATSLSSRGKRIAMSNFIHLFLNNPSSIFSKTVQAF